MSSVVTKQEIEQQAAAPAAQRVGQGTAVEQSRAVAEVQGAVFMARQFPRDEARAIERMREACRIAELAAQAFFRFPRGGQTVSGPSVHLARELARCWGNIDYGVKELSRDDGFGQSEMLAFAWDLETNARAETTFIVPHARDVRGGPKRLTDMRDIYENNANNGARRLRECIFAVLPKWYTEEAKRLCVETIEHGGGKPLQTRIADSIATFGQYFQVSRARLEKRMGAPAGEWGAPHVAQLEVIFRSLRAGEVTVEEEFPLAVETGDTKAEIVAQAPADEPAEASPIYPLYDKEGDRAGEYPLIQACEYLLQGLQRQVGKEPHDALAVIQHNADLIADLPSAAREEIDEIEAQARAAIERANRAADAASAPPAERQAEPAAEEEAQAADPGPAKTTAPPEPKAKKEPRPGAAGFNVDRWVRARLRELEQLRVGGDPDALSAYWQDVIDDIEAVAADHPADAKEVRDRYQMVAAALDPDQGAMAV